MKPVTCYELIQLSMKLLLQVVLCSLLVHEFNNEDLCMCAHAQTHTHTHTHMSYVYGLKSHFNITYLLRRAVDWESPRPTFCRLAV